MDVDAEKTGCQYWQPVFSASTSILGIAYNKEERG